MTEYHRSVAKSFKVKANDVETYLDGDEDNKPSIVLPLTVVAQINGRNGEPVFARKHSKLAAGPTKRRSSATCMFMNVQCAFAST